MAKNPVPVRLSPLAALCLQTIRRWWNVVRRGRGGQIDSSGTPWTRLPADQLLEQLEREHGISVHVRTVRRALQELANAKAVRREQRYAYRWRRDWWYAPTESEEALEAARPTRIEAQAAVSKGSIQPVPIERTAPSDQVLRVPGLDSPGLKKTTAKQPAASRLNEGRDGGGPRTAPRIVWKLQEAVSRAMEKGTEAPACLMAPDRPVDGGKIWMKIGGHWIVDDPRTAPLR